MKKILRGLVAVVILGVSIFVGFQIKKGYDYKQSQKECLKWDKSNMALGMGEFLKLEKHIRETNDFTHAQEMYEYADLVEHTYKHIMEVHITKADKIAKTDEYKALYVVGWTIYHSNLDMKRLERNNGTN